VEVHNVKRHHHLLLYLFVLLRFRWNEEGCKDAVVISCVPMSQSHCYFEIGM